MPAVFGAVASVLELPDNDTILNFHYYHEKKNIHTRMHSHLGTSAELREDCKLDIEE